jgi:hypothetical protein
MTAQYGRRVSGLGDHTFSLRRRNDFLVCALNWNETFVVLLQQIFSVLRLTLAVHAINMMLYA